MKKIIQGLRDAKLKTHLIVFFAVMVSSLGLYFAAQNGSNGIMWGLLLVVVFGNLLALVV